MNKNINEILDAISAEIQREKDSISFDINEEKAKWVNSGIHDGLSWAQEIISRYKEGEI